MRKLFIVHINTYLGKDDYNMKKNIYEQGSLKFESKAKKYLQDPAKTEELIYQAEKKAINKKGALTDVWDKLQLLFDFVHSWRKGEYRDIPTRSVVMILATIIYFISPVDIVPDFIIGFGIVDDAAVIGYTLKQISTDLEKYRIWKLTKDANLPQK
jgi:uncharacterized membrane protein YkvA (DUF1232 family)